MSYLDNITYYTEYTHEDYIVRNVMEMLSYGLLEMSAFVNISRGQFDELGNDVSKLRMVGGQGIINNTRYGSLRPWVWETGVSMANSNAPSPISISGIYCNNNFYPTGTKVLGTGYHVDYRYSHIVFEYPVTGTIQVNRSEKTVGVYSSDSQVYHQLLRGYRTQADYNISGSGYDLINFNAMSQLPCVIVNLAGYNSKALEIGSRAKMNSAKISFDIFSREASDRKRLSNLIYMLEDKSFKSYDIKRASGHLNTNGSLSIHAKTYPELCTAFSKPDIKFMRDARLVKSDKYLPLGYANVSISVESPIYL